jgi:hypothetical protein
MRIPLLAACALLAGSGPVHAKKMMDPLSAALANLATVARCDDAASPWRPWCIAATGWADGAAGDLPVGKVLVGMTIELEDGKDLDQALRDSVSLTAFAVAKDGKVKVTNVKPTNETEVQSAAAAIFDLVAVFKDKQKLAKLPKDVATYLGGRKGTYPTTKGTNEWTWKGASAGRARKVGRWWVVVETPEAQNGFFVTILTDAWASE